jgi:hypothetical protein
MWNISIGGNAYSSKVYTPQSATIDGTVNSREDMIKLVNKLCEVLEIPQYDPVTGPPRKIKDQPQA